MPILQPLPGHHQTIDGPAIRTVNETNLLIQGQNDENPQDKYPKGPLSESKQI